VLCGETVVFRNKLSFAEATKTLLLMFFTSLFVLIQKVTKKSRLHNQGYSGFCFATTKKSKAWLQQHEISKTDESLSLQPGSFCCLTLRKPLRLTPCLWGQWGHPSDWAFLVFGAPTNHNYPTQCHVRYSCWQEMLRGWIQIFVPFRLVGTPTDSIIPFRSVETPTDRASSKP